MAGRPKKESLRFFYDEFYAMNLEQQAITLRILEEHHEYVKQQARKTRAKVEVPETVGIAEGAVQA